MFAIADETKFPLHRLELEITEGAVFDDPGEVEIAMRRLRHEKIRLALDDFGTGYTSLTYLRRLPWNKVKIDKSFVDDVETVALASIVHAIIALGTAIGLKVTAEGVETKQQQQFLKSASYIVFKAIFSQPVGADAIGTIVAQGFAAHAPRRQRPHDAPYGAAIPP